MKSKKITINISQDTNLTDAICKAIAPKKAECKQKGLHQTVKSSSHQELIDAKEGTAAYEHAAWKNQIGIMLG